MQKIHQTKSAGLSLKSWLNQAVHPCTNGQLTKVDSPFPDLFKLGSVYPSCSRDTILFQAL